MRFVNTLERCRRWNRKYLLQAATEAAPRFVSAREAETRVKKIAGLFFERPAAKNAACCLTGFRPSLFTWGFHGNFKTCYRPGCVLHACTLVWLSGNSEMDLVAVNLNALNHIGEATPALLWPAVCGQGGPGRSQEILGKIAR